MKCWRSQRGRDRARRQGKKFHPPAHAALMDGEILLICKVHSRGFSYLRLGGNIGKQTDLVAARTFWLSVSEIKLHTVAS